MRHGLGLKFGAKLNKIKDQDHPPFPLVGSARSRKKRGKGVFFHTREKEARQAKEKGRRSKREARNLKSSSFFLVFLQKTKVSL